MALPVDSRTCPQREITAASKLKSQIKRAGDIDHIPRLVIVKIVSRFPDYFVCAPLDMWIWHWMQAATRLGADLGC
jgi:hypothetical protein